MERNNKKYIIAALIAILLALIAGFLAGRSSVKTKVNRIVEVKWMSSDIVVRDTIKVPVPYEVKIPVDRPIFVSSDTILNKEIWNDYYTEKRYNLDFSNDSLGIFKVDALVYKNSIIESSSYIQPNIKTITEKEIVYKVNRLTPWVCIGSSFDFKTNQIQIGVDLKNKYMLSVSGVRLNSNYGYNINFGYKFK
jgi:hypothetical protein